MGRRITPVVFIMFSVVLLAIGITLVTSSYGEADWTWIANTVVSFVMVLMVFGVGFYTLAEWLR